MLWAWWYSKTGHLKKNEYQKYNQLVRLLKPIIPKPDILIVLVPDSVDDLKKGVILRQKNEPWRKGELIFTKNDNNDLEVQTKRALKLAKVIPQKWQTTVLLFKVNALTIKKDVNLHKKIVQEVKRRLR